MPIFSLGEELVFPHPSLATEEGLLAVGGDLSPARLVLAYRNGIFPWYSEGRPILWWCPSPRMVLEPSRLYVGRSLAKAIRRQPYRITADTAFADVIAACARAPRPGQNGTWITADMRRAYVRLHEIGVAHSVEAWHDDALVGGLYGIALGHVFYGESMFARRTDASKIAFVHLVAQLRAWGFSLIDCQMHTEHLARFGAEEIELEDFLARLEVATAEPGPSGPWQLTAVP